MASKTAILAIRVVTDAKGGAKGLDEAASGLDRFESRTQRASRGAAVVVAGLVGMGAVARREASELQQSAGAVDAVFGKSAKSIHGLAKGAASSLGLARSEYSQMAAVFGAQLKNMGVGADQLVPKTDELITLGGDLAATFGGSTADAVAALGSLLRGERDPIERYGVAIKQADINARLAATGKDKLTGAAKKQAETEATLALLMEQTASAQGQRAREAGTDAQAAEQAAAKMKNAWASAGTAILPVTTAMANGIAAVAGWSEKNKTATLVLTGTIGGLAVAVLAVNGALKVYRATQIAIRAATIAWNVAQKALNISLIANPIGLTVVAVAALVAAFVLAYKKSDTFRGAVNKAGDTGKKAIGWVVDKANALWQAIKSVVDWIGRINWPSPPKWLKDIGGLFGRGSAALGGTTSLAGPTAAPGLALGGATVVNITINGAVDEVSTANQLARILRRRDTRLGAL